MLTSLSMVIGTASLVLVVVAGISGKAYTLDIIQGVGTNLISLSNESADSVIGSWTIADRLSLSDMEAIKAQIPGVRNAAPVMTSHPTITEKGVTRGISLLGTTHDYEQVRNLEVMQGSFITDADNRSRSKVCVITQILSQRLEADPFYKGYLSLYGIRFKVIGVFRERSVTFGLTEISENSAIIPISVMRQFKPNGMLDYMYVSAETMQDVPRISGEIRRLLLDRHGNKTFFSIVELSEILNAANKISTGLQVVLIAIAAISLIASGISIMNIMLITVSERTKEIGLKKSVGAWRSVLLTEFLVEALMLSSGGGLIGVALGVAVPFSIRFFTTAVKIQIPPIAIILGFGVTLLVGLTFGMIPALRAARMNPVEALRYE